MNKQITKLEFDALARAKQFSDGPYVSTFGDGEGEPYQPYRKLIGTLEDGTVVESSTDPAFLPEGNEQ